MLLARQLAERGPLRVLDAMAGCGIRGLRYGREAGAAAVWVNDADPDRLPLLEANLAGQAGLRCTALTAQHLLAGCLQRQERFELVDLDAFGFGLGSSFAYVRLTDDASVGGGGGATACDFANSSANNACATTRQHSKKG